MLLFSWTQWLQLYIAGCLIKITPIYHCIFLNHFTSKHYFTFIQPSSLVLPSCLVVAVTVSCSHFKAKLRADEWLSSDFTVHDVFVSPLVISSCLWLIQAGTQLPDWMHWREENSDFHTFNHVCASVRKEKKEISLCNSTAASLSVLSFNATHRKTNTHKLSEGRRLQKQTTAD